MKKDIDKRKKLTLELLEKSLGVIAPVCKQLKMSRETFYKWMREDEDFKKSVEEIYETQFDFVESRLLEKIKDGSEKSIHFYIARKGHKRGYITNIDLTNNGKEFPPIQINYINPNETN
jgi:transposase-like protein